MGGCTPLVARVLDRYAVCLWADTSSAPPAVSSAVGTVSWKAVPAVNEGIALAGIGIVLPVRGLRPARALAVTVTAAPKTTPCDVVSPVQRVHSPLQEIREDCCGLVLRELDRCCYVVNERGLGHTSLSSRREPPHGARGRC